MQYKIHANKQQHTHEDRAKAERKKMDVVTKSLHIPIFFSLQF